MGLAVLTIPQTSLLSTLATIKAELGITATTYDMVLFRMLQRASSAITRECGRTSFGVGQYQETLKGSGSQLLGVMNVPILNVSQVLQGTEQTMDIEVIDPNDPDQGYSVEDQEAGAIYRPCGWGQTTALLMWGQDAYASMYILPGGTNALRYTVTYTAGYFLPAQDPGKLSGLPYSLDNLATGNDPLYDPTAGVVLDTAVPPTVLNVPPVLNMPAALYDAPPLPGDVEEACLVTVKAWWFQRMRDMTITSQRSEEQAQTFDIASSHAALPATALGLIRDYRRVL